MSSDMFLYWGSGSVPCWKPLIVLQEKGLIGYKQKLVRFSDNEQKGPDVMKLNPRGQVPAFKDGDVVVNESGAICDYLEYKYHSQGQQLLPVDPARRARVLQRVHESQNLVRAVLEGVVYYYFRTKPEEFDEAHLETKKEEAREGRLYESGRPRRLRGGEGLHHGRRLRLPRPGFRRADQAESGPLPLSEGLLPEGEGKALHQGYLASPLGVYRSEEYVRWGVDGGGSTMFQGCRK